MPAERSNVHVFSTSLHNAVDVEMTGRSLEKISDILKWTVDLEDCEKVLRIVSTGNFSSGEVIRLLKSKGYECKELNH